MTLPEPAFEWLFPLRGRWRSYALRTAANLLAILAVLFGLTAAEALSHLMSARNLRVERNPRWRVAETIGTFDLTGSDFTLELGPTRLAYRYPARGQRSSLEPLVELAVDIVVILAPFLLARVVLGAGFRRWAWGFGAALAILLFPIGTACGPMGCNTIQPWHFILWSLMGAG